MLKKLTLAVSAATACAFSGMAAAESVDSPIGKFDVSMNVTLATDYIWRGQSQTNGTGAIQGGLDIAHESGLYVGTWASNIDSDTFGGADVEIDYYVGYAGAITEDIGYDVSWNTYTYPQGAGDATDEVVAKLSGYGLTVGAKYAYDTQSGLYTFISYDYELPYEFGLGVGFGRTDTKESANGSDEKYNDWYVSLSKTVATVDVALTYSDTNISSTGCVDTFGYTTKDSCDTNVTLSVSKSF
jgi:uncharacterized protein (TIGR02001 family)